MYYGSEINEGKDPNENISHSSGCHRADGGGEHLHMICMRCCGFGDPSWEGGGKTGGLICGGFLGIQPLSSTFQRQNLSLSLPPNFAHTDPPARGDTFLHKGDKNYHNG